MKSDEMDDSADEVIEASSATEVVAEEGDSTAPDLPHDEVAKIVGGIG